MTTEHTMIMNKIIGLCMKGHGWPSILYELGYEIIAMEKIIHTKNNEETKPDIIIVSRRGMHILVIECKGGSNITKEQDKRYAELELKTIKEKLDTDKFIDKHSIAYAINGKHLESIKHQTKHPIIVFETERIRVIREFGNKKLNKKLCMSISLKGSREPTMYYPFGFEEEDHVIIRHVVRGMLELANRGELKKCIDDDDSIKHIFEKIHIMHEILPDRHTKEIKKKMKKVIKERLSTNKDLINQIKKIQNGDDDEESLNKLGRICTKYMNNDAKQKRLF